MKPEQLEIAPAQAREVIKLKAEPLHPKKAAAYFAMKRREVRLHREAPGDLAGGMVVRGARCPGGGPRRLADTTAQSA